MYSILDWRTRLYLASQGTISIANTFVEDLVDLSFGSAMLINSTKLSVRISSSKFHNCRCTSTDVNYGGTICVQNALLFDINSSCFSYNFAYGSPDVIIWGDGTRYIEISSINTSSFCMSSTYISSGSCSNWFCADELTICSMNTSSMNSKIRCSGIGLATRKGDEKVNIPKTSFVLIDNCTTANYIIEINVASSTETHILDHFVITNCAASTAVFSNRALTSYSLLFSDSVLSSIKCTSGRWVDSNSLFLSFHTSLINDTPSTDGHAVTGNPNEWTENYNWPDLLQCKRMNWCSNKGRLAFNKMSLLLIITALFQSKDIYQ